MVIKRYKFSLRLLDEGIGDAVAWKVDGLKNGQGQAAITLARIYPIPSQ
jgi:hypothetical protein